VKVTSPGRRPTPQCLETLIYIFNSYFAAEIIGNVLEIEPRRWRRPRRIDFSNNKERVAQFKKKYDKFDWTAMIGVQS